MIKSKNCKSLLSHPKSLSLPSPRTTRATDDSMTYARRWYVVTSGCILPPSTRIVVVLPERYRYSTSKQDIVLLISATVNTTCSRVHGSAPTKIFFCTIVHLYVSYENIDGWLYPTSKY